MNLDELKQGLARVLAGECEWIPVESRLPRMFENVIVLGVLSAEKFDNRAIHEARRFTGYSGPNAGHDEIGGKWEWLTPLDRHVKDVTHWFPKPVMPKV